MFKLHASGLSDSIIPSYRQGKGCFEFLVRKTDPRGFYGDTPDTLKQRAQLVDEYRAPLGSTHTKIFQVLVPDDWAFDPYPVVIAGSHSVAKSVGPWTIWIRDDQFHFEVAKPNPALSKPPRAVSKTAKFTVGSLNTNSALCYFLSDNLHINQ